MKGRYFCRLPALTLPERWSITLSNIHTSYIHVHMHVLVNVHVHRFVIPRAYEAAERTSSDCDENVLKMTNWRSLMLLKSLNK